ncbi:SpoIIE family protein phosphatase [Chitinispirillales bacterium ANBcel5]|uniref:ATP-binding SpoIIE family protein phosphatase n=1 Tax=Cellulosispirillum alkaliphilum TaxID=3039283 RepID=UPI002A57A74F|nr:SpoIIE family protein phosphatase [Chitinispirillales bacterium ANBcel5]
MQKRKDRFSALNNNKQDLFIQKNSSEDTVEETMTENHQADMSMSRAVQAALIPSFFPAVQELDICSFYLPAAPQRGDAYDVIKLSEKLFAFLIFDVTGKGIASTLLSSLSRVLFSKYLRANTPPGIVLKRVNEELTASLNTKDYLTAFLGYLNLDNHTLTFSNAGHAHPVVYKSESGELVELTTQSTPVALFQESYFEDQSIVLEQNDLIFLFTDGLYGIYSTTPNHGRKKLQENICHFAKKGSPRALINHLKSSAKATKRPLCDDISAVAIKLQPDSAKIFLKKQLGFAPADHVHIHFIRYFEDMDQSVSTVLTAMDNTGFSDSSIRKMKISLSELIVNAIMHGNKRDFSKKVVIGYTVEKHRIDISILDEGKGFDPDSVPDPTLPENILKDCGRGIYIARHYCDDLRFNSSANRVTITKFLHTDKDEE